MTSHDSDGDPWFEGSGMVSAFAGILGSGIVCVLLASVLALRFFPFDVCEQVGICSNEDPGVGALELRLTDFAPDGTPSILRSSRHVAIHTVRISLLILVGCVLVLAADFLRRRSPSWGRSTVMVLLLGALTASPYLVLPARSTMVYVECFFPIGLPEAQRAEAMERMQTVLNAQARNDGDKGTWQKARMEPILQVAGDDAPRKQGVALRVLFPPDGKAEMTGELADRIHLEFREVFLRALAAGKCLPVEVPEGDATKPSP